MKLTTTDILARINILRKQYHLTAGMIAEKQGIERTQVNRHLTGKYPLTLDDILAIIEIFPDISLDWLLCGRGDEPFPRSTWNTRATHTDAGVTQQPLSTDDVLHQVWHLLQKVEDHIVEANNMVEVVKQGLITQKE